MENEYWYSPNAITDFPVYRSIKDRAPGFTLEELDKLMRDSWCMGFQAGVQDVQPQIMDLHRQLQEVKNNVTGVIGSYLIHIERHLRERTDARKITIAREREFMVGKANDVAQAISKLRD